MFHTSAAALLGVGVVAADDAASLLQMRSRNAMMSEATGTIDALKNSVITQLDEAMTGKQCKGFLEDEAFGSEVLEQELREGKPKGHYWNSAWFDGMKPPAELNVAFACPTHTLCDTCSPLPEKTCKDKKEVVLECAKAMKASCTWLVKTGKKILDDRQKYAKKKDTFFDQFNQDHLRAAWDWLRRSPYNRQGRTYLVPDCSQYDDVLQQPDEWESRIPQQAQYDELFEAYQNVAEELNGVGTDLSHDGAELPHAIGAFYGAMVGHQGPEVLTAQDNMHDDAYWAHTGLPTAVGKGKIVDVFKQVHKTNFAIIRETYTLQAVSTEGDEGPGASSYVVLRNSGRGYQRDAFVLVGGKIQMVWTTNSHTQDNAAKESLTSANAIMVSGGDEGGLDAVTAVQTAIEVYFNGFVGHDAAAMQSAYHQSNPLFMADFDPKRQAPVACAASDDCGTLPLMNTFDALLPAFEAFVAQPSHIQLNREFTPAGVYGDFAYVSTVSYGCEGNMVTPEGDTPAPNRELFVATRTESDGWKIRFYMFSIDPASPIKPPVEICDLNRDTPGSVWPSE